MSRHKELTGMKFGKLTVLSLDHKVKTEKATKTYWLCECECGNKKVVRSDGLTTGHTQSCGCLIGKHSSHFGSNSDKPHNYKHGDTRTRLYGIWCNMKNRCNDEKNNMYYQYGGRGIKICDEWEYDYPTFKDWSMKNGYNDTLTIDRIDNDKGYNPDNCRWATVIQQANNKRNNVRIVINGVEKTIGEWAIHTGLDIGVIRNRFRRGDKNDRLIRPVAKGAYRCN